MSHRDETQRVVVATSNHLEERPEAGWGGGGAEEGEAGGGGATGRTSLALAEVDSDALHDVLLLHHDGLVASRVTSARVVTEGTPVSLAEVSSSLSSSPPTPRARVRPSVVAVALLRVVVRRVVIDPRPSILLRVVLTLARRELPRIMFRLLGLRFAHLVDITEDIVLIKDVVSLANEIRTLHHARQSEDTPLPKLREEMDCRSNDLSALAA